MPNTEVQCVCGKTLFFKEGDTIAIKCQGCKQIRRLSITELKFLRDELSKLKI